MPNNFISMFSCVYQCGNSCISLDTWFIVLNDSGLWKILISAFLSKEEVREYTPTFLLAFSRLLEFSNTSCHLYPTWILKARELSDVTHINQFLGVQKRVEGGSDEIEEWYLARIPYSLWLLEVLVWKEVKSLIFLPLQENHY